MAIALSQSDYWQLFNTVEPSEQGTHPSGEFDITWKYPEQLGRGYWREICLQDGLDLAIAHYQLHDTVTMQLPEPFA